MNQAELRVSMAPHIYAKDNTRDLMQDVIIALLPTLVFASYFFGLRALVVTVTSVLACVLVELFWQRANKLPVTVSDCSAIVTGLLLAYNLPVTIPLWTVVVGAVFAMLVCKHFYGGLGHNFINPAMGARVFLQGCWPGLMTSFVEPTQKLVDTVTSATPLQLLKDGTPVEIFDLFIGNTTGCIGEVSSLALLIGGIYLLVRRVIDWYTPVAFLGTVALFALLFGGPSAILYHLFAGGLMLGALFMATDYVTSPVTPLGKLLMGFGCGVITALFRFCSNATEGVSYAVLLMNLATPLIDKYITKRRFGGEVKSHA